MKPNRLTNQPWDAARVASRRALHTRKVHAPIGVPQPAYHGCQCDACCAAESCPSCGYFRCECAPYRVAEPGAGGGGVHALGAGRVLRDVIRTYCVD